jgi:hypothetical protein
MKEASYKTRHRWEISVIRNVIEKNGRILTDLISLKDVVKTVKNTRVPQIEGLA